MYHPDYIKKRKAPETSDDPRVQVHALRQMFAAEQKHSEAQLDSFTKDQQTHTT